MNKDLAALRCPSCGAPAAPDAARCEYCQVRLATTGCPVCFKLLFNGAAFCPYCGAARSRSEGASPQAIHCPACRGDMRWVQVGAAELLECPGCDGTWIEADAFERLCADREGQAGVLQKAPPGQAARPAAERVRYRPCPRCRKLMNRMNFGRVSGAIVDICRGHGTFLDRGELHQVMRFILEGGLTRMRQAELDQLKEEHRRLQDLQRDAARRTPPATVTPFGTAGESWIPEFLTALFQRRG